MGRAENDENVPCSQQNIRSAPQDIDRLRFGFKKRVSRTRSVERLEQSQHEDSGFILADVAVSVRPLELAALLCGELGDPDSVLPLLRKKPGAGKYDFKERIAELTEIIKQLKAALFDQMQRQRAAGDLAVRLEAEANVQQEALGRLSTAQQSELHQLKSELMAERAKAKEQARNLQELKEDLGRSRCDQQALRHQKTAAVLRADQASACMRECEAQLAATREELAEARAAGRTQEQGRAEAERRAADYKAACRRDLDQASVLLRTQVDQASEEMARMREVAERREGEIAAELVAARDTAQQLRDHAAAVVNERDDALSTIITLRRESAALSEAEAEHRAALQVLEAQLLEKDHQLERKDADLRESLRSIKEMHQDSVQERSHARELREALDACQREQDALRQHRDREAHRANSAEAQLHDRDIALERAQQEVQEVRAGWRAHEKSASERELEACNVSQREKEAIRQQAVAETRRADLAEVGLATCQQELSQAKADLLEQERIARQAASSAEECEQACRQQRDEAAQLAAQLTSRERDLGAKLERSLGREQELGTQLSRAVEAREVAEKAQARLAQERAALAAAAEQHQEQLTAAQAQVAQRDALLQQKDADLRESMQSVKEVTQTSSEQLRAERQRAERLEGEVRQQLQVEQGLRSELTGCQQELEQGQTQLDTCSRRLSELQVELQAAETERDRLQEAEADSQALERAQREQLAAALEQLGTASAAAAEQSVLSEESRQRAEHLSQQKHMLEVEFHSYKEHHGTSNQQQMVAIAELKLTVDKLSNQIEAQQVDLAKELGNNVQQLQQISKLESQLSASEIRRRELHNAIQELKGNIRVFCRVKPTCETAALQQPEANKLTLAHGSESHAFSFDRVFGATSTQEEIFGEVAGLVQSALDGYKVSIFAYGQTGSGKTYTIQGTPERGSWGLIPRALARIFEASETMRAEGWTWSLQASFLEVYNETLRDLLTSQASPSQSHVIKHNDAWGSLVTNVTCVDVLSLDQINSLMAKAARQRAVGATEMNAVSSRSHSVFSLYLHGTNRELGIEHHGALHLVDLAGSERLDKSGATGERLKETQNINRSLSSLADVFQAKAEGRPHVPFRNSKLTYLMEPCLSGNGKTLMMVTVDPEEGNAHETLCSLRFATQVSQCDTGGKPKRSIKAMGSTPALTACPSHPALGSKRR